MIVKTEDIAGIYIDGDFVCSDCSTNEEFSCMTQDQVFTVEELEKDDRIFFCSRCKKQM